MKLLIGGGQIFMIEFSEDKKTFYLETKSSSYLFKIRDNGEPEHLYWGESLGEANLTHLTKTFPFATMIYPHPDAACPGYTHNVGLREYPSFGKSDYRNPALSVQNVNGDTITDFKYVGHRIYEGKEKVTGMPSTFSEQKDSCKTLELHLYDQTIDMQLTLYYSVFYDYDVIVRSVKFTNKSDKELTILKAMSINVDFDGANFDMISLPGYMMQERDVLREKISRGMKTINSRKGSSSHGTNPFIAVCNPNTTENDGNSYGFNLIYSGNFEATVEVDELYQTRISMGINTETFSWILEQGESFRTPECVLTYSAKGLNGMSQNLHKFYLNNLFKINKNTQRPILFNPWEATMFYFNDQILRNMADVCEELGVEMFVVDDGWFAERDDISKSLGDWYVNTTKFPNGLENFIDYVNQKGMKFGLWFEPEMVSLNSNLYRAHPEWCLQVRDRHNSICQEKRILDLSNSEVCDYIIGFFTELLTKYNIDYVKWDMNRYHSEVGSIMLPIKRQKETAHRFILGLYRIMEELTNKFPYVLFEGCASGGGRLDPGILHYMPQFWTSDNTDPGARLKIQYGTSYAYPPVIMGSHISSVKTLSDGITTDIKTKFEVAFMGNLGLELNVTDLTPEQKEIFKKYINLYKQYRLTIQTGTFYRLKNPNYSNSGAWMTVSEDKNQAIVTYITLLKEPLNVSSKLLLEGLEPDTSYKIVNAVDVYSRGPGNPFFAQIDQILLQYTTEPVIKGKQLMKSGLIVPNFPMNHEYATSMWILEKMNQL